MLFEYSGTLGLLDLDYIHPHGARDDFQENWGGDDLDALSRYDGLQAIRLTALGRCALGLTDTYQPPTGDNNTRGLKVLPNLDIVATGALSTGDQLVLSGYAEHTADRVWTVSAASLLTAINTGREPADSPASWLSAPIMSYPTRWEPSSAMSPAAARRHLAVPLDKELKFRTALLKLGYALPGQPTF